MVEILIDAGPLIALLNPREACHAWALATLRKFEHPLLTSEPVLAETAYLIDGILLLQKKIRRTGTIER